LYEDEEDSIVFDVSSVRRLSPPAIDCTGGQRASVRDARRRQAVALLRRYPTSSEESGLGGRQAHEHRGGVAGGARATAAWNPHTRVATSSRSFGNAALTERATGD
jgi:hypothetical protein